MNSKNRSLYNNKTNIEQKDWGEISSRECGNEIRKAVLDFEKNLIEEKNIIKNHNINKLN